MVGDERTPSLAGKGSRDVLKDIREENAVTTTQNVKITYIPARNHGAGSWRKLGLQTSSKEDRSPTVRSKAQGITGGKVT